MEAEELEWVSLWDNFGLTRAGISPGRSEACVHKHRVMPDAQVEMWGVGRVC